MCGVCAMLKTNRANRLIKSFLHKFLHYNVNSMYTKCYTMKFTFNLRSANGMNVQ